MAESRAEILEQIRKLEDDAGAQAPMRLAQFRTSKDPGHTVAVSENE